MGLCCTKYVEPWCKLQWTRLVINVSISLLICHLFLPLTDWHSWRCVDWWGRGETAPGSRSAPWTRISLTRVQSQPLTTNPDVSGNGTTCRSIPPLCTFPHCFMIKVSICSLVWVFLSLKLFIVVKHHRNTDLQTSVFLPSYVLFVFALWVNQKI